VILSIQVFVDESGGRGQSPRLVFAGVAATAEAWAAFTDDWQTALDAKPKIRRFKMYEASRKTGEFSHLPAAVRDSKVGLLGQIIDRHVSWATFVMLDIEGFDEVLKTQPMRKPLDQPYFWAFHVMIMAVCYELLEQGETDRFEIIFDVQEHFGRKAKAWYPIIRRSVELQAPEIFHLLPIEPLFRSDDEFLPLQAADLFAWSLRRAVSGMPPGPCDFVFSDFKSVRPSEHQQVLTKERILGQIAESRRLLALHGGDGITALFRDAADEAQI
jgi:hypothetical protein